MHAATARDISRSRSASNSLAVDRSRMLAGTAISLALFTALLGLSWDIRWHAMVGRDRFLTPPHVLLYSGVALGGLIALVAVLVESLRFRRSAGRDDPTLVQMFRIFHAPLGFALTGFGMLTLLVAAPFDNWWHELYGIDVTLWAPFHMMGMIGGAIGSSGLAFLFAGIVRARVRAGQDARWPLVGFAFALSMLLNLLVIIASPALYERTRIGLAGVHFALYPLLVALFVPLVLVAAEVAAGRRGTALLTAGLYLLTSLVIEAVVPWGIRTTVVHGGYSYRGSTQAPYFAPGRLLPVLPVLALALVVALVGFAHRGDRTRNPSGLLLPVAVTGVAAALSAIAMLRLQRGVESWYTIVHAGPGTVVYAALAGLVACGVGLVWGYVLREAHA